MKYEIVIPITERNIDIIDIVLSQIEKNVEYKKIIVIGPKKVESSLCRSNIVFLDEDSLFDSLSYNYVRKLILAKDRFSIQRTGWYFQQFIKMKYADLCEDQYYIVWDADLIPLNRIHFFDENGVPYFDVKSEYHKPYFSTIGRLFNNTICKKTDYSYISEHMVINCEIMKSMINQIENNEKIDGFDFAEKIINSIRIVDLPTSGFSEFETYGCYVEKYFPGHYKMRKMSSLREGDLFLSAYPNSAELRWAAASFDLINLERRKKQIPEIENNYKDIISKCSLAEIVEKYNEFVIYK